MKTLANRAGVLMAGVALIAAAVPAVLAQAPAPTPMNPWVNLAPFPNPSEEVLGATANGKLYVFAGLAPGWKPKALVQEFDPAGNGWTQKKPMPVAAHHVAFTTLNDKIYAFGGFKLPDSGPPAWEPLSTAFEYDPAADSWKELPPMASKRGAAAATALNGKLYVIGGATMMPGSSDTNIHPARRHMVVGTVEEYDPATNTWRPRANLPTPRNHHVVAAAGGRIWVIGGRIGAAFITTGSNTDVVEGYDPATDTWTPPRDRMPTPRSAVASGVYRDKVIVAGGEFQDRRMLGAFRAVEAYDPAVNRWSILPSMPNPRHGLAGGVIGERFYAVSGDTQSAGNGAHTDVPFNQALQLDLVLK